MDSSTNFSSTSKNLPKPSEGHNHQQVPKSINVKNADRMETDDKLGEEDLEEPLPMGGNEDKMIEEELECSDDETSHGLNSVYSRGASLQQWVVLFPTFQSTLPGTTLKKTRLIK